MKNEFEKPFYRMTPEIERDYLVWLRWYQVEVEVSDSGKLRAAYLGGRLTVLEAKQAVNDELAAAVAERDRLRAALSVAEVNTLRRSMRGGEHVVCRICDQRVYVPGSVDHAPDCPFAALAGSTAGGGGGEDS